MFDYEIMRLIWWALLGILLIGFAVMDGFDLGVALLLPVVARTDIERRIVINTIGPGVGRQSGLAHSWGWRDLCGVADPLRDCFSGFYLAMFIVLAALIVRPVAIKFRSKIENTRWRATWDIAIAVSGLGPALIFGVAFGNVILGVPFKFDDTMRMTYEGNLLGLLNPFALLSGLISVAMLTLHGVSYLALKASGAIVDRAVRVGRLMAPLTIVLFILAGVWVAFGVDGYVVTSHLPHDGPSNPLLKVVTRQTGAWLTNYGTFPWMLAAPVLAVHSSGYNALPARWPPRGRVLHRQRCGGGCDHRDCRPKHLSLHAALIAGTRRQSYGLGCIVEPVDPEDHAVRDRRFSAAHPSLYRLGLPCAARSRDGRLCRRQHSFRLLTGANPMWYFTWVLGVGFAAAFAILNALWFEAHARRLIDDARPE